MGMGTETVQTQHAAERLALPMDKVRFEHGDSMLPSASVPGGSSQTISVALAVHEAADELVKHLLLLAQDNPESELAGAKFDDIEVRKEGIFRKDHPHVGQTYVAILKFAGKGFVEVKSKTGAPIETLKYSMHSYAAQFCEVRVNRWVGAFDCGRILNPKTAVS